MSVALLLQVMQVLQQQQLVHSAQGVDNLCSVLQSTPGKWCFLVSAVSCKRCTSLLWLVQAVAKVGGAGLRLSNFAQLHQQMLLAHHLP